MTMKKTIQNEKDPRSADTPSQEEVRTAHQIHTLAQMLYGRLAMSNPWMATPPPGIEATGGFTQVPWAQSWSAQPGLDPVAGAQQAPWMQGWPAPPGFNPVATVQQAPWRQGWPVQPATTFGPTAGLQQAPWAYGWPVPPIWGCGCWR